MITITPLHNPRRSLTRSSDALIHNVRPDDVLDAHAQLRRLVEQDVVVDERHADPRGNRDPRVRARPAGTVRPRAKLAPNGVPDRRVAAGLALVQVEEQSNERALASPAGEVAVGVLQEELARVVAQKPQALVEAHEAPLGPVAVPLARG